mgnify:CR=1 FL=1
MVADPSVFGEPLRAVGPGAWGEDQIALVMGVAQTISVGGDDLIGIIVVDEAVFSANARRSMSEENVDWMKLFAIVRHKGHLLIFIAQTSRQVDIQLIDQADLILMKKPSMMQVKTARTELKAQVKEALALLDQKRNSKAWVYVYDPKTDAGKLLFSAMPTWWTEKLSGW